MTVLAQGWLRARTSYLVGILTEVIPYPFQNWNNERNISMALAQGKIKNSCAGTMLILFGPFQF